MYNRSAHFTGVFLLLIRVFVFHTLFWLQFVKLYPLQLLQHERYLTTYIKNPGNVKVCSNDADSDDLRFVRE